MAALQSPVEFTNDGKNISNLAAHVACSMSHVAWAYLKRTSLD